VRVQETCRWNLVSGWEAVKGRSITAEDLAVCYCSLDIFFMRECVGRCGHRRGHGYDWGMMALGQLTVALCLELQA